LEQSTSTTQNFKPALSPTDILLENRIIWLNSDVNDDNMGDLSAKLLILSAKDPEKDIILFINSPGGSIISGLMFYDVMKLIPNDIVTVAVGMAASMGQFLLTMGTEGKRFISKNSRVLLHQPHGGYGGVATEIVTQAELINSMKIQLATLTAERTGKSVEVIHRDGDRDRWFSADEAVEYGFADHIINSFEDVKNIPAPAKKGNKK